MTVPDRWAPIAYVPEASPVTSAREALCCSCHLLLAGIGKSTLLNLIGGSLEPTKGTITRNPKVRSVMLHDVGALHASDSISCYKPACRGCEAR